MAARKSTHDQIKEAAEADLISFIRLVAPHRVLGMCHEDLIHWWMRPDAGKHQLALMPRDHQKSALVAYRVAHRLTKEPWLTFLYISATARLAEKQLYFIQNILTSKVYRRYWPEMVNEESKRELWNKTEINVDHPLRKAEGVRDPSICTAGLTTSITGLHFNIAVLDDVVVKENAYNEEGRQKVAAQYSLLASIESGDAEEWVVGTRYDPRDLYNDLMEMEEEVYNDEGEIIGTRPVYEVFIREVEDRGDGTGEFLWPRQQRADGKWFGFDTAILARKRAKYLDKTQYYAQYYNNPNNPENPFINRDRFQYYDKRNVIQEGGHWYVNKARINVVAAIDFAFSLKKRADYTAIVVIGIDADKNIYVLDIDRFKTDGKISVYFDHIMQLHMHWGFRKLRAECTAAQKAIVKELKEVYIKQHGLAVAVDDFTPPNNESKGDRIAAILETRYANGYIWHYRGGYCQVLEDELMLERPPHDDIKDALAAAVDAAIAPTHRRTLSGGSNVIPINSRFGGVRFN